MTTAPICPDCHTPKGDHSPACAQAPDKRPVVEDIGVLCDDPVDWLLKFNGGGSGRLTYRFGVLTVALGDSGKGPQLVCLTVARAGGEIDLARVAELTAYRINWDDILEAGRTA